MAIYLAFSGAAEEVRGVKEPLGTILCLGPVTNIHRLTPAITQGYAICDIINGFKISKEALAHDLATFTVATLFNEMGASHLFTYILIMEVSTTILTQQAHMMNSLLNSKSTSSLLPRSQLRRGPSGPLLEKVLQLPIRHHH